MSQGAKTKGYIKNLDTGVITKFQYNPSSYSTGRSSKFSELNAPGMSYPQYQYSGGNERDIKFSLFLYGNKGEPKKFIDSMYKLLPPESSKVAFKKPPELLFAFGANVKKCIMISMEEKYEEFKNDLAPKQVTLDITLKVVA